MNAIILHGMPDPGDEEYYNPQFPSASNSHWIPWLQKQLMIKDIPTQTPEMPQSWKPDYELWRKEFERYDITPDTILVGHSCGGGFIVRWLSEHKDVRVNSVLLVAPWIDPNRRNTTDFFDFEIDPALADRTKQLTIYGSDNDTADVQLSAYTLIDTIKGTIYREFKGYGHFTKEAMGTDQFPKLLEAI